MRQRDHRLPGLCLLFALLLVLGGFGRAAAPVAVSVAPTLAPAVGQERLILALGGTFCHPGADQPGDPAQPKAPDCAVCPFCAALAGPAIVAAGAPGLPAPAGLVVFRYATASRPRAPPPWAVSAARPRAPPVLA